MRNKPVISNYFIARDWGTSNLRLYLCEFRENAATLVLKTKSGPGASQLDGDFERFFFGLIDEWIKEYRAIPALLSGMVGSSIGWHEARYLECPADENQIAKGRLFFECRGLEFNLVSRLKTLNPLGSEEIMRGEELQLLGRIQSNQETNNEPRLFSLQGTQNKRVMLKEGKIETFLTALTGELFALLEQHSILITDRYSKVLDTQKQSTRYTELYGPRSSHR